MLESTSAQIHREEYPQRRPSCDLKEEGALLFPPHLTVVPHNTLPPLTGKKGDGGMKLEQHNLPGALSHFFREAGGELTTPPPPPPSFLPPPPPQSLEVLHVQHLYTHDVLQSAHL